MKCCVPFENLGPLMVCTQLFLLSNIYCGNRHLFKSIYITIENMLGSALCSAALSCLKISWRPDAHLEQNAATQGQQQYLVRI